MSEGRERESPRLATEGDGETSRLSTLSVAHLCPCVNCVDTHPDFDFVIAGADLLMPLFFADAADLGAAFREDALVPKQARRPAAAPVTRRPCPASRPAAPIKRLVGVEL